MYDFDVVIPTYNGKKLFKTIYSINRGTFVPKKIYCIFYKRINKKDFNIFRNVEFVKAKKKGQVAQRLQGIKLCKSKLILQSDDDILYHPRCIEKLIAFKIRLGQNSVVGPVFLDDQKKSLVLKNENEAFLKKLVKFLFCRSSLFKNNEGKFTKNTLCYGVNKNIKNEYLKCDWLPGGSILYNHKLHLDFVTFPFNGKAYCEDLFFSIMRNHKGYRHYVIRNAQVAIDRYNPTFNFKEFKNETKIRFFIIKILKSSKIYFFIWVLYELLLRLLRYYIYLFKLK